MTSILHILTRKDNPLAQEIVTKQQQQTDLKVETFDLTQSQPNYDQLLEQIFKTDSVHIW